MTFSYFYQI